jgi:hypothetical protein
LGVFFIDYGSTAALKLCCPERIVKLVSSGGLSIGAGRSGPTAWDDGSMTLDRELSIAWVISCDELFKR